MLTRLTGTLAAAAIAITTVGAAPARADNQDAARVAATLLGIAALAKILSDRYDDDRSVTRYRRGPDPVYRPAPRYRPAPAYRPHAHKPRYLPIKPRHARPSKVRPKPLPPRVYHQNNKLLPKACFKSYPTRRGTAYMFSRHCLERNFRHTRALPRGCAVNIRTQGRTIRGYDARCLRGRGYALARG